MSLEPPNVSKADTNRSFFRERVAKPQGSVRSEPFRAPEKKTAVNNWISDADVENFDDKQIVERVLACKTPHELFGLPRGHKTSKSAASKRFKALARRLHPDKNRIENATKAFQHLQTLNKEFVDLFVN